MHKGSYIYVQIYDDRIEILNPGDLYGNTKLENLGTDLKLEARNKNIVRLLEEKGNIIENRHTGIATMREEIEKMGLPEPEFKSQRGDFRVIFRKDRNILEEVVSEKFKQKTGQKTGQKIDLLNKTQRTLLKLLSDEPYITQKNASATLNLGRTAITENLKFLKNNGYIRRVGSDKKGYWEILK